MSRPIVIHLLRPYANEDEYLAHERSTIDAKTMLLVDQPPLPLDTAVVFDVTLANGEKPIRAEAKVVAHVPSSEEHGGGLRVRFKRYGAATKAFIERAVQGSVGALPNAPSASVSLVPAAETIIESMPSLRPAVPSAVAESGIHRKVVPPVPAPLNREALLSRLRSRKQSA